MPAVAVDAAWASARNVLCVRLDSMGDVLMTGPAIRAIKDTLGRDTRVALLTSPAAAPVASLLPGVDSVYESRAPWMKHDVPDSAPQLRDLVARLAAERFDGGIVFTAFSQTPLPAATLLSLAGIPLALAHSRDKAYRLLSHQVAETEPEHRIRHEVRRQIDLVRTVGFVPSHEQLDILVPQGAGESVRKLLCPLGFRPPFIVVHPGASASSRRYAAERYRRVVHELAVGGLPVVVTHSESEAELARCVAGNRGTIAPALDVAELAALLQGAAVLVTNNTGPAHLAAAVGTPVVDLYAQTNPQHTPWMVASRILTRAVPCGHCSRSTCVTPGHPCLDEIPPSEVVAATMGLLKERGSRSC